MQGPAVSRLSLVVTVACCCALGLAVPGPIIADGELVTLLRFMAVLKAAMAVAAYALVDWRLRTPCRPLPIVAAIAGVALMAAGAGLIWSLAWVATGAVLFHAGLLAVLALAWRDSRLRLPWTRRRPVLAQGVATATATSFLRRNGTVQGGS